MVRHPGIYSLVGFAVVGMFALVYAQLQPRYRLADQVPDRGQAVAAAGQLDSELTGSSPINAMIQLPAGASLYSPETLQVIAEVHGIMQNQPVIGNVWSLETLRSWLAERAGRTDVATLNNTWCGASSLPINMPLSLPAAFPTSTPAKYARSLPISITR